MSEADALLAVVEQLGTMIDLESKTISRLTAMAEKLIEIDGRLVELEEAGRLVASVETQIVERDSSGRISGTKSRIEHEYGPQA
jgi:hypothetical protein